jgi:hypothetical protein
VNNFYCLEEWRGEQRISPPADNFTPIQGTKFTPGGQLRPWAQSLPLGAKLRMGLWFTQTMDPFFGFRKKDRKIPNCPDQFFMFVLTRLRKLPPRTCMVIYFLWRSVIPLPAENIRRKYMRKIRPIWSPWPYALAGFDLTTRNSSKAETIPLDHNVRARNINLLKFS